MPHGWSEEQRSHIDWEVFHQAASSSQVTHVQLLKLVHGKLPTNYEVSKANSHQSPNCHYCDARETFLHLLQCQNSTSSTFRHDLCQSIEQYMDAKETPPLLKTTFLWTINTILHNGNLAETPELPSEATTCIAAQLHLGPTSLLCGFWPQNWRGLYAPAQPLPRETTLPRRHLLTLQDS